MIFKAEISVLVLGDDITSAAEDAIRFQVDHYARALKATIEKERPVAGLDVDVAPLYHGPAS